MLERQSFVAWALAAALLLPVAQAADSAGGAAGEPLPEPAVLELFGHQQSSSKPVTSPVAAEAQREVKRPESTAAVDVSRKIAAPANGPQGEGKLVTRPTVRELTGWRLRDLLPLSVVLAVIVGLGMLLKRSLRGRKLLGSTGAIEVMARCFISSRQSLVLVKLGRRLLLVGVSPDRLSTLCVVEDPDQVAGLLGEIASRRPDSLTQAFENSFKDEAAQYDWMSPPEDAASAARGQVQRLLEKIRRFTRREVA